MVFHNWVKANTDRIFINGSVKVKAEASPVFGTIFEWAKVKTYRVISAISDWSDWVKTNISGVIRAIVGFSTQIRRFFGGNHSSMPLTNDSQLKPTSSLVLNEHFYKRGILLVSSKDSKSKEIFEEEDSFSLNDRRFYFSDKKQTTNKFKPSPSEVKKALSLIAPLKKHTQFHDADMTTYGDQFFLFNTRHREEIFLPILLPSKNSERSQFSMFLYPWLGKRKKSFADSFNGFSNFVTAGCMFGSSLTAIDKRGQTFALIDHHLKLSSDEKIADIQYKQEDSVAFEQVLFDQIEKQCAFINALSESSKPKQLIFHLPAYDYILFGTKLFLNGHLSKPQLDKLIKLCLLKKEEYIKTIEDLCSKYDIAVNFVSPFDNLFGNLSASRRDTLATVLSAVGLDDDFFRTNTDRTKWDRLFVAKCLQMVVKNTYNLEQQAVWKDLLRISLENNTLQFESILNMANAVVIATAAKGKADYSTCSLLPITEKQIQIQYESYSKKLSAEPNRLESDKYPAVFNATFFEQLLAYSEKTKGILFYFGESLVSLASIASKKIFSSADGNFSTFFGQQDDLPTKPQRERDEPNSSFGPHR